MVDLTVIILTKNEEANIRKCISSISSVAKRIVVVDSFSTDRTIEIARELSADVYQNEFINHAKQFNWALDNVNIYTTWVMKIDADEELTKELQDEINLKLDSLSNDINGVILRRRVYFLGRWLKHGGKYPELLLRIFRYGHGRSEDVEMDEHLIIEDGDSIVFKYDFVDNNNKSLSWWIDKHNWYASKEVVNYENSTKVDDNNFKTQSFRTRAKRFIKLHGYYSLPPFFRAHLYFLYRYYLKLGFLDGKEGQIYHFLQAYWYRFLVDAKIFEKNDKK